VKATPVDSRHVFIDESGDPDLQVQKRGVSEYFTLCAVIVDSSSLAEEHGKAQEIINKFFPGGEMKSSAVGNNLLRRQRILEEISALAFTQYSQVIEKGLIPMETGLRFRRSFVKFVHRTLYRKLFQAFTHLHVIAHQHGKSDFMRGFGDYLERRLEGGLFEGGDFKFGASRDFPFIQVADMIAGSIQRCYSD